MRQFLKTKRLRLIAVSAIAVLAVAGVAFAFWTTSGSGSGTAATGTVAGITVNQTSTISGLYPGGTAQTLSGDFDNSNDGSVHVNTVTASLDSVDGGSDNTKPECTVDDFDLQNATATVDADVPSGTGVGSWSGPTIALKDTGLNQDNCKDATLHISYTSD